MMSVTHSANDHRVLVHGHIDEQTTGVGGGELCAQRAGFVGGGVSAGSSFMATVSAGAWRLAGAGSDTAVAVVVVVGVAFEVGFEVVLDVVAAASSARAAYM